MDSPNNSGANKLHGESSILWKPVLLVLDRNWFLSVVTGLDDEVLGRVAEQLGNKFFRAGLLLGILPHDLDTIQVCVLYVIHSSGLDYLDCPFECSYSS